MKAAGRTFPRKFCLFPCTDVRCTLTRLGSVQMESELTRRFSEIVSDPELSPVQHVIEGLMRFLPSDRMSARDALKYLSDD